MKRLLERIFGNNKNTVRELDGENTANYILYSGPFHETTRIHFDSAHWAPGADLLLLRIGETTVGVTDPDFLDQDTLDTILSNE